MSISCSCSALSGSSSRRIWIDADVALELLEERHVLEREEKAGTPARRLEICGGQPDLDPAGVPLKMELEPPRRRVCSQVRRQRFDHLRGQLQHFVYGA